MQHFAFDLLHCFKGNVRAVFSSTTLLNGNMYVQSFYYYIITRGLASAVLNLLHYHKGTCIDLLIITRTYVRAVF